ncbi:hypothetical protein BGX23_005720 [Mortierella sp. AD031]|nr:hypothetical protein BGX23_005720 [Mortierella sp. AD031]
MDELQGLLTKAAKALCDGHAKDAYFGYLDTLDAASIELRKIKFIANVAITSPSTASLITIARKTVTSAQEILAKQNAAIAAAIPEPQISKKPSFRKPSLSRHSVRLTTGQARSVTMLTEQLQAAAAAMAAGNTNTTNVSTSTPTASPPTSNPAPTTAAATSTAPVTSIATSEPLHTFPTIPEPLAISIRQSGFHSLRPSSQSPVIYSPLLRSTNVSIPPKPTRRPPPSPPSEMCIMEIDESSAIDAELDAIHCIQASPPDPSPHLEEDVPSDDPRRSSLDDDNNDNDNDDDTLAEPEPEPEPQARPPLPPKPAHLNRKIAELRHTGDLYLDDDDSDDDGSESDVVQGSELTPDSQTLLRKTSSPSIAIPNPRRRPGPSASVPVSPTHSPTDIPSSPSSHNNRSFSQIHYSLLRQSSVGTLMTVIPEGCVDPISLVEAERINKEDEDQLGQKTYGPSDHLPLIPLSPLRTTHRSLVEKEKAWAAMLDDTKKKLHTMSMQQPRILDDADGSLSPEELEKQQQRQEDENETQLVLQEDLHKCTLQIGNIMSTITKVRELLYRSASTTSILEFQPYLIAYQLTLVESAIFLEIPPKAFLTHSPKTPHRTITASTDFFNYLTRMIEYSILFPPEASGRAQSMNHWIKVAVKLHELENFQTLKAVLCALGTPPIKRLKRTWSFLPRKSANKLETLSELMSEGRNYGRYREMMNSLCAGTIFSSSTGEVASPSFSDSSSASSASISGSRFDILGSWTSSDIKAKEAARRPMVPFIGTFIMDMTYLLAAVKKSSFQGTVPSLSAQIPATSSLRDTTAPASHPRFCPEDDPRIQDLLLTLQAYQAGPKYSPQPPKAYIKASLKGQHHFRAPSLSSALQMTTKYRNNDRDRQSFDEEDDDSSGGGSGGQNGFGGGIRSTQQLILHYLLTRPWVPERMVDELSTIREPSKVNKNSSSSSSSSSATSSSISSGGWSGGGGSISSWSSLSTASSLYSQSTATQSGGSFEGSRPTSVEEE